MLKRFILFGFPAELSPVFIHLPRPTQTTVAEALYQAIWTWIRYSPADFVDLHRKGIRLEGDPSSLFDVCFNVVGDASATGGKKVHSLWSVMTLLIALCPDLIRKGTSAQRLGSLYVSLRLTRDARFLCFGVRSAGSEPAEADVGHKLHGQEGQCPPVPSGPTASSP